MNMMSGVNKKMPGWRDWLNDGIPGLRMLSGWSVGWHCVSHAPEVGFWVG